MKLEVGKYYLTLDGRKARPMMACEIFGGEFWSNTGGAYNADGSHVSNLQSDIIAEWTNTPEVGPARTVTTTRQEIVPGVHGRICVSTADNNQVALKLTHQIGEYAILDVAEMDALLNTLTAIREAMRANAPA